METGSEKVTERDTQRRRKGRVRTDEWGKIIER